MKKLFFFFGVFTCFSFAVNADVKPFGKAFITVPQIFFEDVDSKKSDVIFDMQRFYMGFNWTFDDVYGKATTEIRRATSTSATNVNGDLLRLMKHGFVGWKYLPHHAIELGLLELYEAQPQEKMFRRYITKSTLDRNDLANTADMGMQLSGKCYKNIFTYHLALIAGEGYHALDSTKRKEGMLRVIAEPSGKSKNGWTFAGLAHYGKTDANSNRGRYDLQAFYSWPKLTYGVLGALTKEGSARSHIFSMLIDWQFISKWFWLTRYDFVAPKGSNNNHHTVIAGVEYKLSPHLFLALDGQIKENEKGSSSVNERHGFLHAQFTF